MSKPRVLRNYEKLDKEIKQQLKLKYPYGFDKDLISFQNHKKKFVSALPYEADEVFYLIRMTKTQAHNIITKDVDYDDDGHLKMSVKKKLQEKFAKEVIED